jgi:hypothetical protein
VDDDLACRTAKVTRQGLDGEPDRVRSGIHMHPISY